MRYILIIELLEQQIMVYRVKCLTSSTWPNSLVSNLFFPVFIIVIFTPISTIV